MTLNPYFSEFTWFPSQNLSNLNALGSIVRGSTHYELKAVRDKPGLITASCKVRGAKGTCVMCALTGKRAQFKCRIAPGDKPWTRKIVPIGAVPDPCCVNLPIAAKRYGKLAPEVH